MSKPCYISFASGERYHFPNAKKARATVRSWGLTVQVAIKSEGGYHFPEHSIEVRGNTAHIIGEKTYQRTYRDSSDKRPSDIHITDLAYIRSLIKRLSQDYSSEIGDAEIKIRFADIPKAYFRQENLGQGQIQFRLTFGYILIRHSLKYGYQEPYKASQNFWHRWANHSDGKMLGRHGLWAITLHEFAHLINRRRGGEGHDSGWLRVMSELAWRYQELLPTEEEEE